VRALKITISDKLNIMAKEYFLKLKEKQKTRQRSVIRGFLKFILLRLSTFITGYPVFVNRVLEQKLSRNFLKGLNLLLELNTRLELNTQKGLSLEEEFWTIRRLINKGATILKEKGRKKEKDEEEKDWKRYYISSDNKIIAEVISYKQRLKITETLRYIRFVILFIDSFNRLLPISQGKTFLRLIEGLIFLDNDKNDNQQVSQFLRLIRQLISDKSDNQSDNDRDDENPSVLISAIDFSFLITTLLKLGYLKILKPEDLNDVTAIFDEPSLRKKIVSEKKEKGMGIKSPQGLNSAPLELEERKRLKRFWSKELEGLQEVIANQPPIAFWSEVVRRFTDTPKFGPMAYFRQFFNI
jgi:hypothetical protein